jgi:hypothetical protein
VGFLQVRATPMQVVHANFATVATPMHLHTVRAVDERLDVVGKEQHLAAMPGTLNGEHAAIVGLA